MNSVLLRRQRPDSQRDLSMAVFWPDMYQYRRSRDPALLELVIVFQSHACGSWLESCCRGHR